MTVQEFLDLYPEFSKAGGLVQSALDFAVTAVSEETWGEQYEHALGLRAAMFLSTHPHGKSLRTEDDKDKKSRYELEWERLLKPLPHSMVV